MSLIFFCYKIFIYLFRKKKSLKWHFNMRDSFKIRFETYDVFKMVFPLPLNCMTRHLESILHSFWAFEFLFLITNHIQNFAF